MNILNKDKTDFSAEVLVQLAIMLECVYAAELIAYKVSGTYTEEKNADRRHVGELARGMAIRLFNIQLDKKDRIRKLRDFWSMPWDEESEEDAIVEQLNALSDEERDQKAREFMNKLGWRK